MKKFAYGAFALTAVGAVGQATETGWSGLDQEISSLSATLAAQNAPTGPKVTGYLITALDYESDTLEVDDANDNGVIDSGEVAEGDDTLGWNFRNVRIGAAGDLGQDYFFRINFELRDGSAELRDAYVDWKITDGIKGRWGRYKVPFARTALTPKTKLLFLERTLIGQAFNFRDLGIMVSGQFEMVNFWVNAQNGSDSAIKDMFYNGRVTFDVMGDGVAAVEGSYGAGDPLALSVGLAAGEDSGADDSFVWILEAALTSGPFSVSGEIADFDEGSGLYITPFTTTLGDVTPWSITGSFAFTEEYEIAGRFQNVDDEDDTVVYGVSVNRYVSGHDIKWTLQYVRTDTDAEVDAIELDRDQVALGLTVAF
jgi:phosphate-selective porin